MTRLTLEAPAATITASDTDTRTIAGIALPYGQEGATSLGRVTVDAGAVRMPSDLRRVKLFTEHGRTTPVGFTLEATDSSANLAMRFQVARTPAGDAALLEASEGVRDALSVELDNVAIKAGHVTSADLIAVVTTSIPAFADARLTAADTPEPPLPPQDPEKDDPDADADDEDDDTETDPVETEEPPDMTTTAPDRPLQAAHAGRQLAAAPGGARTRAVGLAELAASFRAVQEGRADRNQLFAALADITWSNSGGGIAGAPVQYLEDLWQGVAYERQIVPTINSSTDLNSLSVGGWVWDPKPLVDVYAGDKTPIPTNPARRVFKTFPAERIAGGHDHDRAFRDFNVPGYWESYWASMTEDYALDSDTYALDQMIAGGTAGAAADLVSAILDGILAVSVYSSSGITVKVSADLLREALSITTADWPAMASQVMGSLNLLTLSHRDIPARTVLVYAKPAVRFQELGAAPIRVEAVNLPNGGIDTALFGYCAAYVVKPEAVQVITVAAGAPLTSRGGNGNSKTASTGK